MNINNELIILEKYKLTCDELMFIRVLLLYQEDGEEEMFKSYYNILKANNISLRDLLIRLQNKEIITKAFKIPCEGCPFNPLDVTFNKNFVKFLFKSSFKMGQELFNAFPQFATINGYTVALRSISKKFDSLEDAYLKYGKYIKWNPDLHNEIVELLNWANEHNIINYSLGSFIVNNAWNDLRSLKNGDNANINYDAVKMI